MAKPKSGAQLYTVRDHMQTIEGVAVTMKKVAAIGYTGVQVSGMGPVDTRQVAKICEDNGLVIAATHVGWDRFRKDLDGVIEQHKIWKCRHPAIGGLPAEYQNPDGLNRFLDELAPVTERLAREGMDFSYHNHAHELTLYDGKAWLQSLYERAGPRMLKAELDLYWIKHGGGDPVEWIRRCAGRQPLCHFKDMAVLPGGERRFAEVGEGVLEWPAIIEAATAAGVEWALVEQDNCYGRDPFECLATSYRNMVKMGLR